MDGDVERARRMAVGRGLATEDGMRLSPEFSRVVDSCAARGGGAISAVIDALTEFMPGRSQEENGLVLLYVTAILGRTHPELSASFDAELEAGSILDRAEEMASGGGVRAAAPGGGIPGEGYDRAKGLVLDGGILSGEDDDMDISPGFDHALATYLRGGGTPAGALAAALRDHLPDAGAEDMVLVLVYVVGVYAFLFSSFADAVMDEWELHGGPEGALGRAASVPAPAAPGSGDPWPGEELPGGDALQRIMDIADRAGITVAADGGRMLSPRFHERAASVMGSGGTPGAAMMSAVRGLLPREDGEARAAVLAYAVLLARSVFPAIADVAGEEIGRIGGSGALAAALGGPGGGGKRPGRGGRRPGRAGRRGRGPRRGAGRGR